MKTLKIKLLIIALLSTVYTSAQYRDIDKLPQQKRDSILLEIAKKTLLKYTEGFYREGITPKINYLGIERTAPGGNQKYNGVKMYRVSYPLDKEGKEYYKKDDAITIRIRADIGRATDFMTVFGLGLSGLDSDAQMNRTPTDLFKYPSIKKLRERDAKSMPKKQTSETLSEEEFFRNASPAARARVLRQKAITDSVKQAIVKMKADSKLEKIQNDSLKNNLKP